VKVPLDDVSIPAIARLCGYVPGILLIS